MQISDEMRVWFDTEFIEDGKTIELVSIGMVREDGATYYAEVAGVDYSRADPWLHENVFVHLQGGDAVKTKDTIALDIVAFVGPKPEFWAYYADYDWIALCQLYGRMIDLPTGWPMFCRDLIQEAAGRKLPKQDGVEHHALADALWTKTAHAALSLPLQPVAWRWRHIGANDLAWNWGLLKPEGPSIHLFEVEPLYATPPAPPTKGPEDDLIAARDEEAVIAGWNACRRSIYAVCEDVQSEAERLSTSSKPGTASEEQHAKGYYAGSCYAAKSIARGFSAMDAMDDDNVQSALRSRPASALPVVKPSEPYDTWSEQELATEIERLKAVRNTTSRIIEDMILKRAALIPSVQP